MEDNLSDKIHMKEVEILLLFSDRQFPEKIRDLFKVAHFHNQEVLRVLFSLKNDLPLKDSSQEKVLLLRSYFLKIYVESQ